MERLVMSSGYEGVLNQKGIKPELVGKLGKCGHMYHLLCLVAMYNNGNKVCKAPFVTSRYRTFSTVDSHENQMHNSHSNTK